LFGGAVRIASCDFKPGKKRWAGEEEEEEQEDDDDVFGRLATFWLGTFAMLFSAIGCVACHENTRSKMNVRVL